MEGLQGLGNINTDNASATVGSPYGYLNKTDVDNRKIALDVSKFRTNEELYNYFNNWFTGTQVVNINGSQANRVDVGVNINNIVNNYSVFIAKDDKDALDIADKIVVNGLNQAGQAKTVVLGYFNTGTNSELDKTAKQANIELWGLPEIYDINSAIDSGDKKLPYMSMGNKLSNTIAKLLNKKYSSVSNASIAQTIFGNTNELSGLGQSVSDGFGGLKKSVTDVLGSLGIGKKVSGNMDMIQSNPNVQQQLNMDMQQPIQQVNIDTTQENN